MKVLYDTIFTADYLLSYNIHACHSKFHVNIFLSNLLRSETFNRVNAFKSKIFTNIRMATFCFIFS